jgi:hypothetical protein
LGAGASALGAGASAAETFTLICSQKKHPFAVFWWNNAALALLQSMLGQPWHTATCSSIVFVDVHQEYVHPLQILA